MGDMSRYVDRGTDGKSFVTRRIAGETILVPVTGEVADLDSVYTLNEVGSFVWDLIDGRRSAQAIAEAVSAEYDVDLERAATDVDELLTALEAKGLARRAAEPRRNT
jgi:coenzyme PQQ synthesis protein D (PqqD)